MKCLLMLAGYFCICKALRASKGARAPEQCAAGPCWALCQSLIGGVGIDTSITAKLDSLTAHNRPLFTPPQFMTG